MTQTSVSVGFGLYALQTKMDARFRLFAPEEWGFPPSAPWHEFSSISDLHAGSVNARPYATYEPDFWLLDGSYKFMPEDGAGVHFGLMSDALSDEDGVIPMLEGFQPGIEILFSEPRDIPGLTFRFSPATGDYASYVLVQYFGTDDGTLYYHPDSVEWSTNDPRSGITHIIVRFMATNRPYRRTRLQAVDFGDLIWFEHDTVREAAVVEDCAPLSDELRAGALDLRLWSDDAQFSVLNPQGDYSDLRERQPIAVHETVDGSRRLMGVYYLNTWENQSENEISFSCTDILGLMDHMPTRGGLFEDEPVEDLLESLLPPAGVPYILDETLEGTLITGWIPAGTLRQALQQIAFAIGASVRTARMWNLLIEPFKLAATEDATGAITREEKGAQQAVALRPQIAGVEVTAHRYLPGTQAHTALDESLGVGTYEVTFDRPLHSLNATGATITESGANYAVLSVVSPGTVTLEGQEYVDTRQVCAISAPNVTGSIKPVLRVTTATLVHPGIVETVAQRVYDYHQQRHLQKVRLYAPDVEVGQVVTVDTLYGQQIRGLVERMSIDLARGMVADIEVVGVVAEP